MGINEGDLLEVSSARGTVSAPARIGDILKGHVFLPFHYGYWDDTSGEHERAANELTLTAWDPVSKQSSFKYTAVQVRKASDASIVESVEEFVSNERSHCRLEERKHASPRC